MSPELALEQEPTWGYTDLAIFTFLSLLCVLMGQLLVHGLALLMHLNPKDDGVVVLPSQLLLYALLFGVLYAIIKLQYGRGFWQSLAWKPANIGPGAAAVLGFALALTVGLLAVALHTPDVDTPMKHLLARRSTAIEFAIVGTTIAPLCEELIFRGFLQPVLVRSLGKIFGILLTAAVFGSLHLSQNAFTWQSGVLITLAGVAFGWMRQITGSTRTSTWMHGAYNSFFFLTLFAQGTHLPN